MLAAALNRYAAPMRRASAMLLVLAACAGPLPSSTVPLTSPAMVQPTASAGSETAWELLDDAPFARLEMAIAAHGGRIWLAGGLSPLGEALTEVDIFDPSTGEWSGGPSLPTAVHHAALVSDGDRLLLIGGSLGSDFSRPSDLAFVLAEDATEWT